MQTRTLIDLTVVLAAKCSSCFVTVFNPELYEHWPRGYKTFSILNSAEHEIFPAHKC